VKPRFQDFWSCTPAPRPRQSVTSLRPTGRTRSVSQPLVLIRDAEDRSKLISMQIPCLLMQGFANRAWMRLDLCLSKMEFAYWASVSTTANTPELFDR